MLTHICVYDFETDSANPNTCEPVQLAACMIHPITLELVKDATFETYMRPSDIDDKDYYTNHLDTIQWHANNYKCTPIDIFDKWKLAPTQSDAFNSFISYLARYNRNPSKPQRFGAPIRAGMNIRKFDNTIIDRLCNKYKKLTKEEQNIFHPRDIIDIMDLSFYWLHSLPEPENYNMVELRKFFGLSQDGAHDALIDVKHEATMIIKYMKLMRSLAPRIQFKGSCQV